MRKSDYPKVLRRGVAVMIIVLLLFGAFAPVAMGQTWPNCGWLCTAKDTEVTDVWLGDASGNKLGSCVPGSIVDAYIWVTVDNGAAVRYQPYLIFDLSINDEDKGQFDECVADTIPKHSAANYNLYHLTWTCGDRVELKNMVLTWATSSATCSDTADCQNHNTAQCNSTAGMIVDAPLVANFTFDNVCFCTYTTFTDKTTGGDGSYTYD
ncbi:MAG: hypothetical protein U9O90_03975 [Euryarchaeota archaeon]|nr:hypothetical protein [Euryarchaeota archaeon]